MGVPGFFLWLWKKYKKDNFVIDKKNISIKCDYLLIDANCLIHPMCFKVLDENQDVTNKYKLEQKMIQEVLKYIDHLIEYSEPHKGIYIAIDGVAPVAKIKQQRSRRFKSVSDRKLWNNIRKKHKKEIPNSWNNSAITPGTIFMDKLTKSILQWLKTKSTHIIFSSANTPSEGEHKLLQFIRNRQKKNIKNKYIIYGLDADLIFLALSTNANHMYLLREAVHLQKDKKDNFDELRLINIDVMKKCIEKTITDKLTRQILETKAEQQLIIDELEEQKDYNKKEYIKQLILTEQIKMDNNDLKLIPKCKNMIQDFIFICYLLGNDFLPHMPSLNIYKNGINDIINTYVTTIIELKGQNCLLNKQNKIIINYDFFRHFLFKLSQTEQKNIYLLWKYRKKRRYNNIEDPYEKEKNYIDNLLFKINDPVKLGMDNLENSRIRYYKHYFKVEENEIDSFAEKICHHYFIGIEWITKYYFDVCPSWDWYFPFEHAPFITDLYNYINKHKYIESKFELGKPLCPFEQLLSVLPPQSAYLLPPKLQKIILNLNSSLAHLYPMYFEQDFLNKNKYWQGIPHLPSLEINLVKKHFRKYAHKLTENELDRNKIKNIYELNCNNN